uniref:C-type lectin domain-containing protein n=1 Tax=Anas platyrhynchos platyrhynchos TaxID=8840 RepID=A0A493T7X3_ANAPP
QRSAASYFLSDFLRNSSSSPTEDSWKCCPEGWRPFQESCYYFSDDQMTWDKSQQNCSGMGSQLVVINTEAEQVSAGLGEGQSSLETGVPGLGEPQSPSWLLQWRGDVLAACTQHWLLSATSSTPLGLLPPLTVQFCYSCRLLFFFSFF